MKRRMGWLSSKFRLRKDSEGPSPSLPERPRVTRRSKRYDTRLSDSPLGAIVDLSTEGARIVCHGQPPVRAGHVFEISLACDTVKVFILARVAWTRKVDANIWNVGLHFFEADASARADIERLLDKAAIGREVLPTTAEIEDLYEVLGVRRDATLEQIRSAYRALARRYHPDHAPNDEASRQFARISKAYMVLRDESLRRRYDQLLSAA